MAKIILEGMTVEQFWNGMRDMVRQVLREETEANTPLKQLPERLPAKVAARELGFKTIAPLKKYHGRELSPIREGRKIFYRKSEVVGLITLQKMYSA